MPTLTNVRLYGPKDTEANWKKNNPSITAGEIIIVTDSKYKFKIATSSAKYNDITFPVAEKATQLESSIKIGNASFNGTADITLAQIGAAASSHTHTKSQITDFPSSMVNPNSIIIKLNGGTTEGTNLFTYNGSSAKTLNITASSIAAAPASHTHTKSQITDFPTSMPASDVSSWAKASTKPSYSKSEVGLGNVDNTSDANKSVKYAGSSGSITFSQLTSNNLNDLKTEGKWYYAGGDNSCTNIPVAAAFELYVGRNASGYRYQQFTTQDGNVYIRVFNASSWGGGKN